MENYNTDIYLYKMPNKVTSGTKPVNTENEEISFNSSNTNETDVSKEITSVEEGTSQVQSRINSINSQISSYEENLNTASAALSKAQNLDDEIQIGTDKNGKPITKPNPNKEEIIEQAEIAYEEALNALEEAKTNLKAARTEFSQTQDALSALDETDENYNEKLESLSETLETLESKIEGLEKSQEIDEIDNIDKIDKIDENKNINNNTPIQNQQKTTSTKTDNDDIQQEMFSQMSKELEKLEGEIKANDGNRGLLGEAGNAIAGWFNKGSKGKLNENAKLQQELSELQNSKNPDNDKIEELYTKIFGYEPNMAAIQESIEVQNQIAENEEVKEAIVNQLLSQVDTLKENFTAESESQGIFTKAISGINNVVGIGTTKDMAEAQMEQYQKFANQLKNIDDPDELASLYKSITGEELTNQSIEELMNNTSKVDNSKASETAIDYKDTNEAIKNTAVAVGVGVAVATTGPLGAIAIGAGATVGVNAIDCATQTNGKGPINNLIDYAKTDLVKDALVGGLNGLTGKLGNVAGEKLVSSFATKSLGASAVSEITETATKNAIQKGLSTFAQKAATNSALKATLSTTQRLATEFVDGSIDAGLAGAGEYIISAAAGKNGNFTNNEGEIAITENFKENFDAKELLNQTATSAALGGVMSVGLQEGMQGFGKLSNKAGELADDYKFNKNGNKIVTSYSTMEEAFNNAKVGDVCLVDDMDNIIIRTKYNTMQPLEMSKKTFAKLFPDGSNVNIHQQNVGDCYLVSTIYSMMEDPVGRMNVLKCFTENADGSITVKLPNGNVEFTMPAGSSINEYVGMGKISTGSEGAKMLEYTYGLELLQKEQEAVQKDIAQCLAKNEEFTSWVNFYDKVLSTEGSKNVDVDGFLKEMDDLSVGGSKVSDFYDNYREEFFYSKFTTDNGNGVEIDYDKARAQYDSYQKKSGEKTDNLNKLQKTAVDLSNPRMEIKYRDGGGYVKDVYKTFGFNCSDVSGEQNITDVLTNPENWDKYIFGASTRKGKTTFLNMFQDVVSYHAYSIKPIVDEATGEVKVRITNPWHTNKSTDLTIDKFIEYFDYVTMAEK